MKTKILVSVGNRDSDLLFGGTGFGSTGFGSTGFGSTGFSSTGFQPVKGRKLSRLKI